MCSPLQPQVIYISYDCKSKKYFGPCLELGSNSAAAASPKGGMHDLQKRVGGNVHLMCIALCVSTPTACECTCASDVCAQSISYTCTVLQGTG